MFAIIYIRVSTQDQLHGFSFDFQRDACMTLAKREGWTVVKVFEEPGVSGKTIRKRKVFQKAKEYVAQHPNITKFITWKLDRFGRDVRDSLNVEAELKELGCDLVSAMETFEDSPSGRLTKNMTYLLAQHESETISLRVKAGMKEAVKQGFWVFSPPLGYSYQESKQYKHRLLTPNQDAELVKLIFKLRAKHLSLPEINEKLKARGYETFPNSRLHRIVHNPLYCGEISCSWFAHKIQGKHEPIVSKNLFYQASDSNRKSYSRKATAFNFNSFAKCPKGHWLSGYTKTKKKTGKVYIYYKCHNNCVNISEKYLEHEIYSLLDTKFQINPDLWDRLKLKLVKALDERQKDKHKARKRIVDELSKLKDMEDNASKFLLSGTINEATYKRQITDIKEKSKKMEAELNKISQKFINLDTAFRFAKVFGSNSANVWKKSSISGRRAIQRVFFPQGLIVDQNKSVRTRKKPLIFNVLSHIDENNSIWLTKNADIRTIIEQLKSVRDLQDNQEIKEIVSL